MKIVKIIKNQTKLLNLGTPRLKTKILKKNHLNYGILKNNLEFKLKNALNIIFKFHSENKKILFLGTPIKLNNQLKELLKNTKHSFIPEQIWLSGILTNTKSIFRLLFKKCLKKNKNNLKLLFDLKNKNDIVVIINEFLNRKPLYEFLKKGTPTISLNYSGNKLKQFSSTYKIKKNSTDIGNKSINNLFFSILTTTLKKAEKVRIEKIKISLKQKKRRFSKNNKSNFKQRKFFKKNALFKKKKI